ncbi:anterior gradient protein 3-like [Stegostoma tigrinum]|uniref:anterior gradient protein 3-like n=1 Tax=Stegostoma tigrinum TaxID=3053191 RepID=UPI00202B7F0C|nr:anterior gradient protein 3-like [Stegostoma tigrinum]
MVTNGVAMIEYIFGSTTPLESQLSPNSTQLGFVVTWRSNRNPPPRMAAVSLSLLVLLAAVSSCLARGPSQKAVSPPSKSGSAEGKKCPPSLSRGWGDEINWVQTYEEGLHKARKSNRPLMVIHHLEDCQFSQALKQAFAQNEEIQKMAKEDFVMLNLVFETNDSNLSPEGQQYVPRIMFVDPSLTVRADIKGNYSNRKYAYEPKDIDLLIANMKTARNILKNEL